MVVEGGERLDEVEDDEVMSGGHLVCSQCSSGGNLAEGGGAQEEHVVPPRE